MATFVVGTAAGATHDDLEDAVAAASAGDTIVLQAGTINLEDVGEDGHVVITENLTIIGQGEASTTLVNVNDNPNAQNESNVPGGDRSLGAAIDVDGAGVNVNFANFTFDGGDGAPDGGLDLGSGLFFDNGAGGSVLNVTIQNVGADVEPLQPVGTGIRIEDGGGTLVIDNVTVRDFERTGISVFDAGTQVFVDDSTFIGQGAGPGTLNYGIFVGFDASVQVTDSSFTDFAGTIPVGTGPEQNTSAGILNFSNSNLTIGNSTFTNNYTGIVNQFANATINAGNFFTSNVAAVPGGGDTSGLNILDSVVTGTQLVAGPNSEIIFDGLPTGEGVQGGPDDDQLFGDDGDDTITGNGGNDEIDGGADDDTARYSGNRTDYLITASLAGVFTVQDLRAGSPDGTDQVRNVEFFEFADVTLAPGALGAGTPGPDVIVGTPGPDVFDGGGGADDIRGLGGDDRLSGGADDDILVGGEGNDTLDGGTENDRLDGGNGDDQLAGDDGNDIIVGGAGTDAINGGDGDDNMRGGDGNDQIAGGNGNDRADGNAGDDTLIGQDGADDLRGDAGDDFIYGGNGADELFGGADADTFEFRATSESPTLQGADHIQDFNLADGDVIRVATIDADETIAGNQAFDFIGTAAFTDAGQIRYFHSGGETRILLNTDNDTSAEAWIVVRGIQTPTDDWFVI
jgi:hypothetical protein